LKLLTEAFKIHTHTHIHTQKYSLSYFFYKDQNTSFDYRSQLQYFHQRGPPILL
jgi:hypothetical protein